MQCAHCLSEMPEGATVCAQCGRKQPMSTERKMTWQLAVLATVVVLPILGFVVWSTYDDHTREAAVERIVKCAHLHGDKNVNKAFVNNEIDVGIEQTGKGWRVGTQYAALSAEKSGLSSLGACFITQETLFSN